MEMGKKKFRKMFSHLAEELEAGEHRIAISSVRTDTQTGESASSKKFAGYMPDVVDFIRRCDNTEQAEEIISYMEGNGGISREYAERLRKQLKEKGVRSFGSKKEEGYYFRQGLLEKC